MNELFSTIPFYTDKLLQNRFKKQCVKDCLNPIISPNNRLPCFQFRRETNGKPITDLSLYDIDDNFIAGASTWWAIHSFSTTEWDYFIYLGDTFNGEIPCGKYYLKITTVDEEYFSEVFEVKMFKHFFEPETFGIIYNGNFANTSHWFTSSQWAVTGTSALCTPNGLAGLLAYSASPTNQFPVMTGLTVRVTFTLTNYSGGWVNLNTDYNLAHG